MALRVIFIAQGGGSASRGYASRGSSKGLHPGGSSSRGVCLNGGVDIQGGLPPSWSASRGVCIQGVSASMGVYLQGDLHSGDLHPEGVCI